MSNDTTTADSGKSDISARDYIFSGTPEQFTALIGYAKQSVLAPRGLERIPLWVSGESAVFSFTTMERLDGCTMVKAQIFTGDWARFEPVLTDLQALAVRAGYTLLPLDNETVMPEFNDNYRYWFEIHTQAKASGNVSKYLQDRDISRSSYYDKVKQYGLK